MIEAIEEPATIKPEILTVPPQVVALRSVAMSILLIGPESCRRNQLKTVLDALQCGTIAEVTTYPELDQVPKLVT